jgi:hypothetical protein
MHDNFYFLKFNVYMVLGQIIPNLTLCGQVANILAFGF